MRIRSLKLENFMGVVERGFQFPEGNTIVSGMNGAGKTTLMDAHLWLWTDYNSALKNNPPIRPLDGRECIVKVSEVIVLESGAEVQVAKIQKEKRSKPDENGKTRVIGIINSYEINGVGKTERDFKADLVERGLNIDRGFLELSHPEVFISQKAADMRKILFTMAKSHTDREIAEMTAGCEEVAELLKTYKLDEVLAMKKADKKKAEAALKDIPNQIIGLNMGKIEIDVPALTAEKQRLQSEIDALKTSDLGEIDAQIVAVHHAIEQNKISLNNFETEANREIAEKRANALENIAKFQTNLTDAEKSLHKEEAVLDELKASGRNAVTGKNACLAEILHLKSIQPDESDIQQIEAEKFDDKSLSCPVCGRPYPEDKQSYIRSNWEENRRSRLEAAKQKKEDFKIRIEANLSEANVRLADFNKQIANLTAQVNAQKGVVEEANKIVAESQKALDDARVACRAFPIGVDCSGMDEYKAIKNSIEEREEQLVQLRQKRVDIETKNAEISFQTSGKKAAVAEIDKKLMAVEYNRNCDEQIAKLEARQRREGQNQANAERILAQIDAVSKKRNELVSEEINSNFKIVRFKLFDYLKNGEYKEVCIPEVKDGEEWKTVGGSANTALSTIGKLDIVDGLQKFYGQNLPVFVDFAAELDQRSMAKIESEMQLIFLAVSNGQLEVKGVV